MKEQIEGSHSAENLRIAIVASRFNDEVGSLLIEGAVDCLEKHGAATENVDVFRVPGAFEIPTAARWLIDLDRYDAIVAIGVLVRGETPHFDFISAQVTNDISRIAIDSRVAVAFGVITCNTFEQAFARTEPGKNKGWEAALAAIEMANLLKSIRSGS
jgi:6,7-dimethyl-8-ribityllumazine synthase